ncbi:hypothetical protein [Burkholderia phage Bp-AMP4]|uniref:Uncharacterized protein n=5 Tax=Ampunavirus BpAMP1 TaxID=2733589 RepID=A0A0A8KXQ0_9CAUD|nr:hypothetical protein [Burkholderia phage Bp-AMP4]
MANRIEGPRAPQESDREAILAAGQVHIDKLCTLNRSWAKHINVPFATDEIVSGRVPAFVYGDYLVAFDIGGTWNSPGVRMFEELLTLRLHPGSKSCSYRQVVWCMESLARANGCVGVLLGTVGAYDDKLGRVIERLGYERAGGSFYKEV